MEYLKVSQLHPVEELEVEDPYILGYSYLLGLGKCY